MNILQKIFIDHYEEMIYTLHPRKSVIENGDKMIHCGDVRPDRTEVEVEVEVDERRAAWRYYPVR